MLYLGIAVALIVGWMVFTRMNEFFCLSIRNGETILVRGRIPGTLYQDLSDIAKRAGVERGTVRAVGDGSGSRLAVRGVNDRVEQRMRNAFGIHPTSKLKGADPMPSKKNIGQILGIAWLAWLFAG